VRIERGLVADGQPARQATTRLRSVSCCWQNMGRERLGPESGWWVGGCWQGKASGRKAAIIGQIHVTPHRATKSLGETWKGGCFLLRALSTRLCNSWHEIMIF
jgi:hypothetical protein